MRRIFDLRVNHESRLEVLRGSASPGWSNVHEEMLFQAAKCVCHADSRLSTYSKWGFEGV